MRRLAAPVLAFTLAAVVTLPALAQSRAVDDRLTRIERALADLQNEVYAMQGQQPPAAGGAAIPTGDVEQRLSDIETSLRRLTGQLEDVQFRQRQLQTTLERVARDLDFRVASLEGGQPTYGQPGSPLGDGPPASGGGAVPAPQAFDAPAPINPPASGDAGTGGGTLGFLPRSAAPGGDTMAALPGGSAEFDAAKTALARAQYADALAGFERFVAASPGDARVGEAQFWRGEIYYLQADYQAAARAYAEGLRDQPDGPRAPDSMVKLGQSLVALGQKQEGCTTLASVKSKYPRAGATVLDRAERERRRAGC